MLVTLKRLALGAVCAGILTLVGCGGGGGSGSSAATSMTVTPSLGQFSAGTRVILKRPGGSELTSGTVGPDGRVTLQFSNYTGPIEVEVQGVAGVTYYDEGTRMSEPYRGSLRAFMPAPQSVVGVTALTNAAAARLIPLGNALTTNDIRLANTKVAVVFGYTDGASILQVPTLVNGAAGARKLDVATVADRYALILAALAKTANSGKTKADVVEALALDLKNDDELNGRDGASMVLVPNYTPATITARFMEAATELADDTSQRVVAAQPFVAKDATGVKVVGNQSDVDLAKALFAELRTTLNAFSNDSETGFLDTQAIRTSNDLNANVAPALGTVASRIDALGESIDAFEDAKAYSGANPMGFVPGPAPGTVAPQVLVRTRGNLNAVWYGFGTWSVCHTDGGTAAAVTRVTCSFAESNGADYANNRIRLLTLALTRTAAGQYSYSATRNNLAISFDNFANVIAGNTSVAAGVPTGSGTVERTVDGDTVTGLSINGTMPPSTGSTGADTIAISAARTALTGSNFRYAITGSVAATNLADATKIVTLALDTGSHIDLNESTDELIAARIVGVIRTVATRFSGSVEFGSFMTEANGQQRSPTRLTFNGSISDTSSGGAGQILTGQLDATVTDYHLYNSFLPESSSNFLKTGLTFVGTVQAPERPLLRLVLGANRTGVHGSAVTLNYSYGPTVSITGSGTIDDLNPGANSLTLSNQAGIQVVTRTGLVTRSGSATPVATIVNGVIHYEDGVSESLL